MNTDYRCKICNETVWENELAIEMGDGIAHDKCANQKTLNMAASAMGKIGGASRSAKKVVSSRENGKKGGRPKKN